MFEPVREAARPLDEATPAALRTIGEILASVELDRPAEPGPPTEAVLSRDARFPALPSWAPPLAAAEDPEAPTSLGEFPELPPASSEDELGRRYEEYLHLGRRLGQEFADFEARGSSARLVGDPESLAAVVREMFVHLTSALAEEYEEALARRNELAAFSPVQPIDAGLTGARRALLRRDLTGAQRRLALVRDELHQTEEEWAVGRILITEGELLAATVLELGGDPAPALGPFEEGRHLIESGRRSDGERLLARGAIALWSLLEPRLVQDLGRLRDRLLEMRAAGADIRGPIEELRGGLSEFRQRNFVGTIVAYRRVRAFVDQQAGPADEPGGVADDAARVRPSPPL